MRVKRGKESKGEIEHNIFFFLNRVDRSDVSYLVQTNKYQLKSK